MIEFYEEVHALLTSLCEEKQSRMWTSHIKDHFCRFIVEREDVRKLVNFKEVLQVFSVKLFLEQRQFLIIGLEDCDLEGVT